MTFLHDAAQHLDRVPSVLGFLVCLTIVAECADAAGVFDHVTAAVLRRAQGRVGVAWCGLLVTSAAVTAFLSLDTTAVLMTSAAVVMAKQLDRPALPFALPVLWLANMGSLWLPVSNLTNLLARHELPSSDALGYLRSMWLLALVTTVVPVAFAALRWRHELSGRVPGIERPHDPTPRARRGVGLIVLAMCAGLLVLEPVVAAAPAALLAWLVVAAGTPRRTVALPWRSVAMTAALFVIVAVLQTAGALAPLTNWLHSRSLGVLMIVAGGLANLTNNLPTYLALEPSAHEPTRVAALLIGVNVLSGLTWWGSVATLLWRDRCRRGGLMVSWRQFAAITAPVTALTGALALTVLVVVPPTP